MMAKTICLVCVTLVVCLSVSEAILSEEALTNVVRRSLPLGEGEGFEVRFECSAELLEKRRRSLSIGCLEFLTTEQATVNSTFSSYLHGLCTRCGEPLYRLILDCVGGSRRYLRSLDVVCATNELGSTCYDAIGGGGGGELFSDCAESPCSESCRRDLMESNQRHGCCMFSAVSALSDVERAEGLWLRCNVEPPTICNGAFASSTSLPENTNSNNSAAIEVNFTLGTLFLITFLSIITILPL